MKNAISTFLFFFILTSLFAQSPNAFKYQTIIRDNVGNVSPNKSVQIQVSILQSSATGTAIYKENHAAVSGQSGLINLEIGHGTAVLGNFSTISWGNGPYFIKISVDGTEMGTNQLLSVPYAKYADIAGNGFSGNYNDLTNKPTYFDGDWNKITNKPGFANVSFSGSYNDLGNKPVLFDGTWTSLSGKPTFSTVAYTGSYTDLTNKPDYSWSSILGKPTTIAGYGITDAMTTAHPSNSITNTSISNWNTAYSWGDHATKGYAVASNYYSKVDLQTSGQSQVHWNNIKLSGRPTTVSGYGITDAMTTSHPSNSIVNSDITNWNLAYSWGNHQLAGYAIASNYYTKTDLQTAGQAQVSWGNITNIPGLASFGFSDVSISSPANNQLLRYNSSSNKWENWTPNFLTSESQTLTLTGNSLSISGGNSVTFTLWDTDKSDDVILTGNQSIAGNKTFTGTITSTTSIMANAGLNANNNRIVHVAEPSANNDAATKAYVDLLIARIAALESKLGL